MEADLSNANLANANLSGVKLYGANLYGADLTGADLSEAIFFNTDLFGAKFHNVNGPAYIKDGKEHWFLHNIEYEDEKLYCAARDILLALFPNLNDPQQQQQQKEQEKQEE